MDYDTAMRWLMVLLLAPALARAQEVAWPKGVHACAPLECEMVVPEGWTIVGDRTGFSAIGQGMGMVVSREPLFHDEKEFAAVWQKQIDTAGRKAKVETFKVGRYGAWGAAWEAAVESGMRAIRVARVYVPDVEMLYNLSLSAPAGGADLKAIADGVLKGFKFTGSKRKFEFQKQVVGEERMSVPLPEGYEEQPRAVVLGGGGGADYAKVLPGYGSPHIAGALNLYSFSASGVFLEDGTLLSGTDLKGAVEAWFKRAQSRFPEITAKPKDRSWRCGREKAHSIEVGVRGPDGLPKLYFAAACRVKQTTYAIELIIDAREERLYKDLFKQLCSEVSFKE